MIISYSGRHFSPLFTEKIGSKTKKITLVEGGKVLTDDAKIAKLLTRFLVTLWTL